MPHLPPSLFFDFCPDLLSESNLYTHPHTHLENAFELRCCAVRVHMCHWPREIMLLVSCRTQAGVGFPKTRLGFVTLDHVVPSALTQRCPPTADAKEEKIVCNLEVRIGASRILRGRRWKGYWEKTSENMSWNKTVVSNFLWNHIYLYYLIWSSSVGLG